MKIKNFFRRTGVKISGNDTKALLIKHAIDSEDSYRDLVNVIDEHLPTPEKVIPVVSGLSRAVAELIRALEWDGCLTREQFEEILNIWLNEVSDDADPYSSVVRRFEEYRRMCD